jgi:hypothetical protein
MKAPEDTIPHAAIAKLGHICMIDFAISPDNHIEDTCKLFTILSSEIPGLSIICITSERQTLQQ